ncbi:hypothetical protein NDU88_001449 [Pleurodeles waltl]|uniref:Uncharacterized protein n=1 Tax=Pleurodeles waltl TaxID=8319 RepID=A0AAV7NES7_PLEWA|nr:hypothetical protein NDU88_001449 [Pleurodeles waltl]
MFFLTAGAWSPPRLQLLELAQSPPLGPATHLAPSPSAAGCRSASVMAGSSASASSPRGGRTSGFTAWDQFSYPGGPLLPHAWLTSLGPAPRIQGVGLYLPRLRLLGRRCCSLTGLVRVAVSRARPTVPSGPLTASPGRRAQFRQRRRGWEPGEQPQLPAAIFWPPIRPRSLAGSRSQPHHAYWVAEFPAGQGACRSSRG